MAKITGGLFSLQAHGALGKRFVFTSNKHSAAVKNYAHPDNPRTLAQLARRQAYTDACAAWQLLTQPQKNGWALTAKTRKITGFNLFVSDWLKSALIGTYTTWDAGFTTWDGKITVWFE